MYEPLGSSANISTMLPTAEHPQSFITALALTTVLYGPRHWLCFRTWKPVNTLARLWNIQAGISLLNQIFPFAIKFSLCRPVFSSCSVESHTETDLEKSNPCWNMESTSNKYTVSCGGHTETACHGHLGGCLQGIDLLCHSRKDRLRDTGGRRLHHSSSCRLQLRTGAGLSSSPNALLRTCHPLG